MAINKMVMAIIERQEAPSVLEALVSSGYTATFGDSRSGVLRQAKQTLFIGVDAEKLDDVLDIIQCNCRSRIALDSTEAASPLQTSRSRSFAEVGSAVVFVWDIDRFETF
jgi:uncharacterized protein YaaQ